MDLINNMEKIKPFVDVVNDDQINSLYKLLYERVEYPESFVTLVGETSSGKSSLINGFLQKNIIHTSSEPTTGTVIELFEYEENQEVTPYALLKSAKLRRLNESQFCKECLEPSEDVERLRLHVSTMPYGLTGMRLFDTPGYGSIYDQHEKVLNEFVPNSDVIIYLVNYRTGFGIEDANFLSYLETVIFEDTAFFLVVNRVPENTSPESTRILEITKSIEDILKREVRTFLIPAIKGTENKLPLALDLWSAVGNEIHSNKRLKILNQTLLKYQIQLLQEMSNHWNKKVLKVSLSEEDKLEFELQREEFIAMKSKAEELIEDTFARINTKLPELFSKAKLNIENQLAEEVLKSNKWTAVEECYGYVNSFALPKFESQERNQIVNYIESELNALNNELEEILNQAFVNFTKNIEIISNHFEPIIEGITKRIVGRSTDVGLKTFLAKFGGRGGAGAGVANLGKKTLKNVGKIIGKKFTRDQHNQLATFLKKIGATSTRNLTIFATFLVEGVFYVYGSLRWQKKLIKETSKGLVKWQDETSIDVINDMNELKQSNMEGVNQWFNEIIESFEVAENPLEEPNLEMWQSEREKIDMLIEELEGNLVYESTP